MAASRLLIPSALLLAVLLGACNAPDLASYDSHTKFGADVVEKTAVLFLDPAANGAVQSEDRPRLSEFAKDFRDRNAGPIGIAVGATSVTDPAAVAFASHIRDAFAAQPERDPELLAERVRLRILSDDPEARHQGTHRLEVERPAQHDVVGLVVEPVQLHQDVPDVSADAEIAELPGVDRHRVPITHARLVR